MTPAAAASSAEPSSITRKGALAWASALMPRIAAIAARGIESVQTTHGERGERVEQSPDRGAAERRGGGDHEVRAERHESNSTPRRRDDPSLRNLWNIRHRLEYAHRMDALVGLVDGIRARGAFVLRLSLDPPWAMRIEDEALTLICQTRGSGGDHHRVRRDLGLAPGDVALARGTEHYAYSDDLGSAPQVVVHPGQRCTTSDGRDLRFEMAVGVRTWGNSATGADRAVIGAYEGTSEVGSRLLDVLPAVLVLRSDELDTPLVALLSNEAARDCAGQVCLPRSTARLTADRCAAYLVRAWRRRTVVVVRRIRRPRRHGATADLQQPGSSVDGG